MTKTNLFLIIITLFCNCLHAQNDVLCNEIRAFEFPTIITDEWEVELEHTLSKLIHCNYDLQEIEMLKLNSFVGYLLSQHAVKTNTSLKVVKAFNLGIILDELDILKKRDDYGEMKEKILTNLSSMERKVERQMKAELSSLYLEAHSSFDATQHRQQASNRKGIIYFRNGDNHDCQMFEDFVLKEESIIKSMTSKYEFYILETNEKDSELSSEESANSKLQLKLGGINSLPFMVLLNENGEVEKQIKCSMSLIEFCNSINLLVD